MKKVLIIAITAVIIIGVAFVAYDSMSGGKEKSSKPVATEQASASGVASSQNVANDSSTTKTAAAVTTSNDTSSKASDNNTANKGDVSKASATTTNVNANVSSASATTSENQNSNKSTNNTSNSNNSNNTSNTTPVPFGDIIPGTHNISRNVFLEGGTINPKSTSGLIFMCKETSSPLVEGNITISANTPYTEYSGYSTLFKYYIIKPYQLNDGPYQISQNLNANNPSDTNFNETANNLTAIAYMQGGTIVAINSSGQTVYVSANSVKKPITFEKGNIQYFEANAIINTDNVVPVRNEPGELPTFNTIGNKIQQKGQSVVAIAQVNNFTKIIFGTNKGFFGGWIPSSDVTIQNYS